METELRTRLIKVKGEVTLTPFNPDYLLTLTIQTLEAIRAHQCELYPGRAGEEMILSDAIDVVKDYQ